MSPTSPLGSPSDGVRKPRLEIAPPFEYSFGEEACELARRAGLVADPWQADAVELMMAVGSDGLWACPDYVEWVPRQNGKGIECYIRALAGLFLLNEELQMWSAHQYKTAMRAFLMMRRLIRQLEESGVIEHDVVKINNTNGEEGFELRSTGSQLLFVARSHASGRGFSAPTNYIDEALYYTFVQQEAMLPTTSAFPNAQTIFTSTPPISGDMGEVMYLMRQRAELGEDLDGLGYRDFGLAGDLDHLGEIDLDDRELWFRTNPAMPHRVTERTVIRERKRMSDEGFARERLGMWPRQSVDEKTIDPVMWARLVEEDTRRAGQVALGVDVNPSRDYAAIVLYGPRDDGLMHAQLTDHRPGTAWVVPRLLELRGAGVPVIAVGMGRATAAALAADLRAVGISVPKDAERPREGDLAVPAALDLAAATGGILEAVRNREFRVKPSRQLDLSVWGAKVRQTGDIVTWNRKDADCDIAPLVALTVARWAWITRSAALKGAQYDLLGSVW